MQAPQRMFILRFRASGGFFNGSAQPYQGADKLPTIKNAKEKTEAEAKKAAGEAKKVGAKIVVEAKKGAADIKKAGSKVVSETKKEAKKVKGKI